MTDTFDLSTSKMNTVDLIQQMAVLSWANNGDAELYKLITSARIVNELYNRVSHDSLIEQYQAECILGIVDYVKKNPRASENELAKVVQKHIDVFKSRVDTV